jgi:hypothetical protein
VIVKMSLSVAEAQNDMREGYCSGGAGVLASALAWSVASVIAILSGAQSAVLALLIGGALIHPVAVILCKILGARGGHTQGNPLAQLAASSTVWLILCLPLAYALSFQHSEWFFSAMLLIIGGRYAVFATLYGMPVYWVLGLLLAATGVATGYLAVAAGAVAVAGASIEWVFAGVILRQHHRWVRSTPGTLQRVAAG